MWVVSEHVHGILNGFNEKGEVVKKKKKKSCGVKSGDLGKAPNQQGSKPLRPVRR